MKNLKITFILTLFVTTFLFISCQSDATDENDSKDSTGDYWPMAIGNQWVSSLGGNEYTMKIISSENVEGHTYYKFDQFVGVGEGITSRTSYSMRKDKRNYYIKMNKVSFEQGSITGEITAYEFLLLKDYLDVNKSWTGHYSYRTTYNLPNVPPLNTAVDYTGTILEKGTSLTVKGVKYNDVIKFRISQKTTDMVVASGEVKTYTSDVDYWVAKNIGIIKMATKEGTTELVSYTLK